MAKKKIVFSTSKVIYINFLSLRKATVKYLRRTTPEFISRHDTVAMYDLAEIEEHIAVEEPKCKVSMELKKLIELCEEVGAGFIIL